MSTEEEQLHAEQRITISDSCRQSAPRRRKEYLAYLPIVTTVGDPNVVHVDLILLKAALRGDELWAESVADRSPDTFMPERYARAIQAVREGKPMHHPWLSFRYGRIRVTDGRHRLYALLDEGYTHVEVATDPWHGDIIRTIADPATQFAMPLPAEFHHE